MMSRHAIGRVLSDHPLEAVACHLKDIRRVHLHEIVAVPVLHFTNVTMRVRSKTEIGWDSGDVLRSIISITFNVVMVLRL